MHEACEERAMLTMTKDDFLAAKEYVEEQHACFCDVDPPFAEPES